MSLTVIFGDVHGCADEFSTLLNKLDLQPGDRLISVGDLIKKGPDSAAVIHRFRTEADRGISIAHVLGNHEASLRQIRGEARLPRDLQKLVSSIPRQDLDWLLAAPLHIELPEFGARILHGGVLPAWQDLPPADFDRAQRVDPQRCDELVRARNVSAPGKRRSVTRIAPSGHASKSLRLPLDAPLPKAPQGGSLEIEEVELEAGSFLGLREIGPADPNWPDLYDGRFGHIYFGHQPFLANQRPVRFPHATGLDLGCVYGGFLAAVVLEADREPREVLVRALKEYSRWGF